MRQDARSPASSTNRQGSDPGGGGGSSQDGNSGTSAFMTLAAYIFGKNDRQEKMAMTMPVFSDSSGRMQFFMGNNKVMHSYTQRPLSLWNCKAVKGCTILISNCAWASQGIRMSF